MTDSVCSALGIDRVDMKGKVMMIEEQHGSDGNFIVNSVISSSLEKGHGICLVLFHNTFGHYHNIGMKLGYNLKVLRDRGQVTVVEPMKLIEQSIQDLGNDSVDASSMYLNASRAPEEFCGMDCMKLNADLVRQLFVPIKNQSYEVLKTQPAVMVVIDDLSHLFDIQLNLHEVWFFVKYLKSLIEFEPSLSICILAHTYKADPDSCQPDLIAAGLRHMSQLVVSVEPLITGYANDVSGKMTVYWKQDAARRKHNFAEKVPYLFKLTDRQVKVFAPGSADALS